MLINRGLKNWKPLKSQANKHKIPEYTMEVLKEQSRWQQKQINSDEER